jgi:UDP-N-acetylmuramyl pentapeptide phosphotransferase/UDP-N-acetylglucosamine-1-phosphate transferase
MSLSITGETNHFEKLDVIDGAEYPLASRIRIFGSESDLGLLAPLFVAALAAALSSGLTFALRPILMRYALAKPNSRSSHTLPTPQGAGIAVIAATLAITGGNIAFSGGIGNQIVTVFVATIFIAIVGIADDIKAIPVLARLIAHAIAVGSILLTIPSDLQIIPTCPLWIERTLLLVAGVWFVNLVNFMDGLDWMTVAEVVPVTSALVTLGFMGALSPVAAMVATALCGAMLGFAPFNRPIAKIFLGDVGSLPIGLLLGWILLDLASHDQTIAAILLPLYYIADATITMLRRALGREPFWVAHRSHFYQRATNNGFTVLQVVSNVFLLNVALAAFAILTVLLPSPMAKALLLLAATLAVTVVMYRFQRPPAQPIETPAPR